MLDPSAVGGYKGIGERTGKDEGKAGVFSFGSTTTEKDGGKSSFSRGTGQGMETGTTTTVKPVISSDMTKPFTFGTSTTAAAAAKPLFSGGLGQGSSFPITTSASKPFASSSTFSSKSSTFPSTTQRKVESKPASPPEPVEQPPAPPKPVSSNQFEALNVTSTAASNEPEVITIDSDDDMVDDQNDSQESDMVDDTPPQDAAQDEDMEQEQEDEEEEKEEDNEAVYMLDSDDDARDKDYVVEEAEEEEEVEEEPGEEDVAKEVEELVKETPERKEKGTTSVKKPTFAFGDTTKPFNFGAAVGKSATTASAMSSSETTKPKEPEMSEIKPPPPVVTVAPSSSSEAKDYKSQFRFGMPTTPSTFKPLHPITDTPSSALRKEFKFGLPSTSQKAEEQSKEPLRRVTRSSSPGKRPAEEDEKPVSPVKQQRSSSPRKTAVEKVVEDTIEVKEAPKVTPFVFGSKLHPEATPFTFGAGGTDTKSTTSSGDMFGMGTTGTGTMDTKPTFNFGATAGDSTTKPPFSFGGDTTKPTFTIGAGPPSTSAKTDYTWTPDKPIKFDTPPHSITSSMSGTKPALPPPSSAPFAFGQSSSSGTTQPFKFGGLSTPIPASPKFGTFASPTTSFGAAFTGQNVSFTSSPNLGFSFGQSPSATKPADPPAATAEPEAAAAEEAGEEEEPPVVSEEVGAEGEEDEETVFSERAKLIQRLSNKERQKEIEKKGGNPNEVKMDRDYGVGVVRVNVHKETKKGRILFRLEGSGRVVLVLSPPLSLPLAAQMGFLLACADAVVEFVFGAWGGLC